MPREGFRVDWKKRMTKAAVCNYFGDRGRPFTPKEIIAHWVGTYTMPVYDDSTGCSTGEFERVPALAVVIQAVGDHCDTEPGKADVYGLTDIYGELIDEVPRPRKRR